MCGLGAILRTDGEPIPDAWLDALETRIAHRGPDGNGRFRDRIEAADPEDDATAEVAIVHRRLSIIDHGDGAQPMVSERGRSKDEDLVAVAFNGCIYNHRDLRRRLEAKGHVFATDHSDTEVLLHGHREWGEDLPDHLEGMYAYVLWDRAAGALVRSRDWFGEKPLYECRVAIGDGYLLVAASDARAVANVRALAVPELPSVPPARWCASYLQLGYGWRGATAYGAGVDDGVGGRDESVSAVRPGLHQRLVRLRREREDRANAAPDALAALIEDRLERAVERRLEADVPLGCFLSGGVDSSLVAHFARKHQPDLKTYCIQMPDPRYDESAHAERVAAQLGTTHTTLTVDPDPAADLVHLVQMLGQPFGDSSILPTYWVSRAARAHVKVALSGDGADELFFGYERYVAARTLARTYAVLRRLPSGFGAHRHPKSMLHKFGRLIDMARDFPRVGILAMEALFTQKQLTVLLGAAPDAPPHRPATTDAMAALRMADVVNYLPGDLLTKVDTASMAVALEVRCPYLDRDLAAVALTSPPALLTPGRKRKGLLRTIARKHLPADVVDRRKMGFAVPIGEWFRTDYGGMKVLLLDHLMSKDPFGPITLTRRAVRRLIVDHLERRADHGHRLFTLLTLSIWAKGL